MCPVCIDSENRSAICSSFEFGIIVGVLGLFNILGGSCYPSPVGYATEKWECGQFDWTICSLSWVRILSRYMFLLA